MARGRYNGDKYSRLKAECKLHGTVTEARAKRKVRDRLRTLDLLQGLGPSPSRVIIPLGAIHASAVMNCARREYPTRRRWVNAVPTREIERTQIRVAEKSQYYHGRLLKSKPIDYEPQTRSFAVVTRKRLCWYISTRHELWVAPKGWHFGTDCRPGTAYSRVYACRDSFPNDVDFRWYFNSDDVYRGEPTFWRLARQHVKNVQQDRRDKKEYARITSTVITVELIVPHRGVRTIIRVQRTGPMRMRYGRDFVS